MKYITLIIGLLVVGCGKQEQTATEKPVKELTAEEKKVVGEYEAKEGEDTKRIVLFENGILVWYVNGKKEFEGKWSIVDREIHLTDEKGNISIGRINKDESITGIATMNEDGKREEIPKEDQQFVPTFKKIK